MSCGEGDNSNGTSAAISRCGVTGKGTALWALRGSGTTDRVAADRVIVAFGLARNISIGTSATIGRCGVTAIGAALWESRSPGWVDGSVSYLIHLWCDDSGDVCLQEVVCAVAGYRCQGEDIGAVASGFAWQLR